MLNKLRVFAAFAAAFSLTAPNLENVHAQTVTRGPYLQTGTPTSVIVRWRTDTAVNSRVQYGTDELNLNLTVDDLTSTTEHEIELTGLSPNTVYYYSIGTTTATLASDSSYFFETNPADGTRQASRIWIIGDSGTADQDVMDVRDAYENYTGATHTNLWVMLGDNAYNVGNDSEYQSAVFDIFPEMLRKSVLWPAFGNHDGLSAESPTESGPFYDIFSLPRNAESGGFASGTEAYYSFNYANIHFVCLNSEDIPRGVNDAMLTWLENDLAANTLDWVVAFWHHPPYSKGSHDSDSENRLIQMRENALPILENGGVDLVFTGHSHSYERSYLLDGHYGDSVSLLPEHKLDDGDGREDGTGAYTKATLGPGARQGAVYIVAGSGGQTSSAPLDHPAMYYSVLELGSVVLDIDGGRADVTYIDELGNTLDYFTIIKGVGAPAAPTGLTATTATVSSIDLAWKDNATDETGYSIERHSGDGNFAEVATTGADFISFTDSGLMRGTTYTYRVHAVNAAGNSDPTNEASATTFGQTYIVAETGGDFTTIQAALNAAQPGDSIAVREKASPYFEKLIFPTGGDAVNGHIVLSAYANEFPILDGTGVVGDNMIFIDSKSYIKIHGFEIRNNTGVSDGSGFRMVGSGSHIEFRNNVIHDIRGTDAMGITIYGGAFDPISNIIIDGNEIYDCEPLPSEALTINGNVTDFEVTNNIVRDVNNIGIDFIGGETWLQPDQTKVARNGICRGNTVYRARENGTGGYAGGIYVDGGKDIVIENNTVYECDFGVEVGAENAGLITSNITVRNNVLYNNDKAGLVFGGYDATVGSVENCSFTNNVLYKNDVLNEGVGEVWIQFAQNNDLRNNIFYSTGQNVLLYSEGGNVNNTLDYNLWYTESGAGSAQFTWQSTWYGNFSDFQSGSGQDANSVFNDPLFDDAANADFHVSQTSPAVNAGDPTFVADADETDLDGDIRIIDGRVDIGADEVQVIPPPLAPSALTANEFGAYQIDLAWTDNSFDETGFRLERHSGDGNFATVVVVAANVTSYSDVGLAPASTYTYRVVATSNAGDSDFSNAASATTTDECVNQDVNLALNKATTAFSTDAPDNPENATDGDDGTLWRSDDVQTGVAEWLKVDYGSFVQIDSVIIDWQDKDYAEAYEVQMSDDDVNWTTTFVASKNDEGVETHVFTRTTGQYLRIYMTQNRKSTYKIAEVETYGCDNAGGSPQPPAAPSGLFATANGTSQIDLSWTDNSLNETSFKIERHDGDGNYVEIASVGAGVTNFNDTGLSASTTYNYRVRASNGAGHSGYSNVAVATTADPPPPAAPSGLTAAANSASQIDLSWTDNSSNETGFKIERHSGDGNFVEIAVTAANITSYNNTGLSASTSYTYRVRATNGNGDSNYSNEASATTDAAPTPPAAPATLTATANGASQIDLSWTDNSNNEDNFKIERHAGDGNFAEIATVGANVVSYNDTGLSASTTYTYRVRASNGVGDSGYSNEAAATTDAPPPPPAAPSSLTATANGASQIDLSWTDNANNETGFKIERHAGDGNFAEITTIGADVTGYNDTGLSASTTYTYRVRATNDAGDSGYSNEASATTNDPPPPADPSALTATANGVSQIDLAWTDNASDESNFKIERHSGDGNFAEIATVGANVTGYSNTGLSASTTYTYRVRASNGNGDSGYSNEAAATTDDPPTAPADPSGLTATANGSSQIDLSWSDNSNNEDGFKVQRHSGDGNFAEIATLGADVASYNDIGLNAETTYTYRVFAFNNEGDSGFSNEASATTDAAPVNCTPGENLASGNTMTASSQDPDDPPSNTNDGDVDSYWRSDDVQSGVPEWLKVDFGEIVTVDSVVINWESKDYAEVYEIQHSTDDANWTVVVSATKNDKGIDEHTFAAASARYVRLHMTQNNKSTYRINEFEVYGCSGGGTPTPPAAPTALSASANGVSQIDLSWTDNSNNEDGFRIERHSGDGNFAEIATVGANVTSFSSTSLNASTTYTFRVRAYNGAGNSNYSNTASATTDAPPQPPAAPSGLTATANGASQIDLSWMDNANNEDNFKIERHAGDGNFAEIATVSANVTSYNDTGLSASTTYAYRVRASNGVGNSGYSNEAAATTDAPPPPPAAPSGLIATTNGASHIDLSWTDNANNEDNFKIERHAGDGNFAEIATVGANVTSYDDTGLSASTTYAYRVRAGNGAGNSGYSNDASATTDDPPPPPADPSGLTATANGSSQIDLSWTDNANNEDNFKIERHAGDGNFAEIATVGANVTNYDDTGLSASTTYTYRVRASNGVGDSGYSNEASATTEDSGVDPNTNLALNQPATASSVASSFVASNGNDGNESTAWGTRNVSSNQWLRIDLGSPQPVGRAIVRWNSSRFATSYEFQASDDDVNWFTIYSTTSGASGNQEFTFTQTTARYVRLLATGFNQSSLAVNELEVYSGPAVSKRSTVNSEPLTASEDASSVYSSQFTPTKFALHQNYPNPFNPNTTIQFDLPKAGHVSLNIYNSTGRLVRILVSGNFAPGAHKVVWDARDESGVRVASGLYFYTIKIGQQFSAQKKLLLMK